MEKSRGVLQRRLPISIAEFIQNRGREGGRQLERDDIRVLRSRAAPAIGPRRQRIVIAVPVFLIVASAECMVLVEMVVDLDVVLLALEDVGAGSGAAVAADRS